MLCPAKQSYGPNKLTISPPPARSRIRPESDAKDASRSPGCKCPIGNVSAEGLTAGAPGLQLRRAERVRDEAGFLLGAPGSRWDCDPIHFLQDRQRGLRCDARERGAWIGERRELQPRGEQARADEALTTRGRRREAASSREPAFKILSR